MSRLQAAIRNKIEELLLQAHSSIIEHHAALVSNPPVLLSLQRSKADEQLLNGFLEQYVKCITEYTFMKLMARKLDRACERGDVNPRMVSAAKRTLGRICTAGAIYAARESAHSLKDELKKKWGVDGGVIWKLNCRGSTAATERLHNTYSFNLQPTTPTVSSAAMDYMIIS